MASYAEIARHKGHSSSSSESDEDQKRTHRTSTLPSTSLPSKLAIATGNNPARLLLPHNLLGVLVSAIYVLIQSLIAFVFAPPRPKAGPLRYPRGHIAIIGAGVTGVSSAAHFLGHGFEVTIFDEYTEWGGIWSRVNSTSGLQLNSMLYRFFPTAKWSHSFPKQDEILSEVQRVVSEYRLEERARLGTKVKKVERHSSSTDPNEYGHARWIINGVKDEVYDGIIVAVGTCGKPKMIELPGQNNFKGKVVHSSQLDTIDLTGKRVSVVGAGASGVEAVELALSKDCKSITLLARSPHWIIPRNLVVGSLLAMQPFGREMPLSFIPETLLRRFHYKTARDIAPTDKGLFVSTPVVNDTFLAAIRDARVKYLIGDVKELCSDGIRFSRRSNGTKPGSEGKESVEKADVIVVATGFERPSIGFLPNDLFPARGEGTEETYDRPNLYLQNFSVNDWSICLTNSAYVDAIGTAGHIHVGWYARLLALFLVDKRTRPHPADMRMWVDMIRWIKRSAPGGALEFFTYSELSLWLLSFHLFRFDRIRWAMFTLCGFGMRPRG